MAKNEPDEHVPQEECPECNCMQYMVDRMQDLLDIAEHRYQVMPPRAFEMMYFALMEWAADPKIIKPSALTEPVKTLAQLYVEAQHEHEKKSSKHRAHRTRQ